jgi:hypothetical protein
VRRECREMIFVNTVAVMMLCHCLARSTYHTRVS